MHKIKIMSLIEWMIAFSCIFLQYKSAILTYGMIILLIAMIMINFIKKEIIIDKRFLFVGIIILFQEIITILVSSNTLENVFKNGLLIILVVLICSQTQQIDSNNSFFHKLKIVALLSTIGIFIQSIQIYILHQTVNPILLLFQTKQQLLVWVSNTNRPCGFFSEPQVYCSYMIPILIICMEKRDFKFSLLLSIGILLSGSSLGIIALMILWGKQLFCSNMKSYQKFFLVSFAVIAIIIFVNQDTFLYSRNKLFNIFTGYNTFSNFSSLNEYSYSNYMRLLKSWVTFFELPLFDKILGIGINNLSNFVINRNISFSWNFLWSTNYYYSSAGGVFLELGFIVGCIYYAFIINNYKKQNNIAKNILLFIIIQSFSTQMFFNGVFIYNILLCYAFKTIIKEDNVIYKIKF